MGGGGSQGSLSDRELQESATITDVDSLPDAFTRHNITTEPVYDLLADSVLREMSAEERAEARNKAFLVQYTHRPDETHAEELVDIPHLDHRETPESATDIYPHAADHREEDSGLNYVTRSARNAPLQESVAIIVGVLDDAEKTIHTDNDVRRMLSRGDTWKEKMVDEEQAATYLGVADVYPDKDTFREELLKTLDTDYAHFVDR